VTAGLLAGAGIGAGLWLVVVGLWPARPSLTASLAAVDRAGRQVSARPAGGVDPWSRFADRLAAWWGERGWDTPGLRADLAVTNRTLSEHVTRKVGYAAGGLFGPSLLCAVLSAAGVSLPLLVPMWASLSAAAVAFLLPDVQLRQQAAAARREFRVAVGGYLDLVAMRMASGAGLAEALADAAAIGAGPAFTHLRGALADARTDGLSPAASLARLGEELHLPDLVDTATRLSLVDATGAQAQASLRAQAASLRDRELADAQGRANEGSQSMLVAQVVLGFGFVVFLGYPAVAKVLAT
jgi:tight adherence protein C